MSNRITYSAEEQALIRTLPEYKDRANRRGGKRRDWTGHTHNGFTVLAPVGRHIGGNHVVWLAENAKGDVALMMNGRSRVRLENFVPLDLIPTYIMWSCMIDRCYNQSSASYASYGNQGIRVAREWLPDGEPTHNGTTAGRAAAFRRFLAWAKWDFGGIPAITAGGVPEVSRPHDFGDYGPHCKVRSHDAHVAEAKANRGRIFVPATTRRGAKVVVARARQDRAA
jgi:hypothetical protein